MVGRSVFIGCLARILLVATYGYSQETVPSPASVYVESLYVRSLEAGENGENRKAKEAESFIDTFFMEKNDEKIILNYKEIILLLAYESEVRIERADFDAQRFGHRFEHLRARPINATDIRWAMLYLLIHGGVDDRLIELAEKTKGSGNRHIARRYLFLGLAWTFRFQPKAAKGNAKNISEFLIGEIQNQSAEAIDRFCACVGLHFFRNKYQSSLKVQDIGKILSENIDDVIRRESELKKEFGDLGRLFSMATDKPKIADLYVKYADTLRELRGHETKGFVLDSETNVGIAHAEIILQAYGIQNKTGANGRFQFRNYALPANSRIVRPGYISTEFEFPNQNPPADIFIFMNPETDLISGKIVDDKTGKAIANAIVKIGLLPQLLTDEKGEFTTKVRADAFPLNMVVTAPNFRANSIEISDSSHVAVTEVASNNVMSLSPIKTSSTLATYLVNCAIFVYVTFGFILFMRWKKTGKPKGEETPIDDFAGTWFYLTQDEVHDIHQTALNTQGVLEAWEQLLGGISRGYVSKLGDIRGDLHIGLLKQLNAMNEVQNLGGGEIPLEIWLKNAAHVADQFTGSTQLFLEKAAKVRSLYQIVDEFNNSLSPADWIKFCRIQFFRDSDEPRDHEPFPELNRNDGDEKDVDLEELHKILANKNDSVLIRQLIVWAKREGVLESLVKESKNWKATRESADVKALSNN